MTIPEPFRLKGMDREWPGGPEKSGQRVLWVTGQLHNGFLLLDKTKFADLFAADVEAKKAAFMVAAQMLWG